MTGDLVKHTGIEVHAGEKPQETLSELNVSPAHTIHNGTHAIRDVNLDNPIHYQELLDALRREPFFRSLPEDREENPELYDRMKDLLQDFIHQGNLLLYENGVSIHEARPGEMQVIVSGELQMKHNRYSRRVPSLQEVGFDGPRFTNGQALGSWSMAGQTNSHFAEIETNRPSLILSIPSAEYERLILETLEVKGIANVAGTLSNDDVNLLRTTGVLRQYSDNEAPVLAIERQRDFTKRSIENTDSFEQCKEIWNANSMSQHDFVILQGDTWVVYDHKIQSEIKSSTLAQHLLQKNFVYGDEERKLIDPMRIAEAFRNGITNEEFLSLSRNISRFSPASSLVGAEIDTTILLATFPSHDVEHPELPMKDCPTPLSSRVRLEVESVLSGDTISIELPLPSHGVIDPQVLLDDLIEKGELSEDAVITQLEVVNSDNLILHKLDEDAYRKEVVQHTRYNFDKLIDNMKSIGYAFESNTEQLFRDIFSGAEDRLNRCYGTELSLSLQSRQELIELTRHWMKRDTLGRRDSDPIQFNANKCAEIAKTLQQYIEYREQGSNINIDSLLQQSNEEQKIALVVSTYIRESQLKELDEQSLDKLYYRDVKHIYGSTVDEELRQLEMYGYELTEVSYVDTPWASELEGDLVLIPDRHEDLYGMRHELQALGILTEQGDINLSTFAGNRLVFLGDVVNRRVSSLGYGSLQLVEQLIEAADEHNRHKDPPIQIEMILGNHELDLLKMSDSDLRKQFPEMSDYITAREVQKKLHNMIAGGFLKASLYLGNAVQTNVLEQHALVTHAGVLPSFKKAMYEELESGGRPQNDLELSDYLNEVLCDAVKNNDFSHSLFLKSTKRGGESEISGPIEADMGSGKRGDLIEEMEGAKTDLQNAFGYQIVGHSFDSKNPHIRTFKTDTIELPGCIIADCGDHQAFGSDPDERIASLVIKGGVAYEFRPKLSNPQILIQSEETVYALYKERADAQLIAAITQLQKKVDIITLFNES